MRGNARWRGRSEAGRISRRGYWWRRQREAAAAGVCRRRRVTGRERLSRQRSQPASELSSQSAHAASLGSIVHIHRAARLGGDRQPTAERSESEHVVELVVDVLRLPLAVDGADALGGVVVVAAAVDHPCRSAPAVRRRGCAATPAWCRAGPSGRARRRLGVLGAELGGPRRRRSTRRRSRRRSGRRARPARARARRSRTGSLRRNVSSTPFCSSASTRLSLRAAVTISGTSASSRRVKTESHRHRPRRPRPRRPRRRRPQPRRPVGCRHPTSAEAGEEVVDVGGRAVRSSISSISSISRIAADRAVIRRRRTPARLSIEDTSPSLQAGTISGTGPVVGAKSTNSSGSPTRCSLGDDVDGDQARPLEHLQQPVAPVDQLLDVLARELRGGSRSASTRSR